MKKKAVRTESTGVKSPWVVRRQMEPQLREEKLDSAIHAAAVAFAERGFERTSMGHISDILGVTKPTLYNYFPSKAALFNACHRKAIGRFAAAARDATQHEGTGSSKLKIYLRRALEYSTDDLGRAFVLLDDRDLSQPIRRAFQKIRKEIEAEILEFVREAMRQGDIAAEYDDKLVARTLVAAFNTIPIWYRPGGRMSLDEIAEQSLKMFFEGLSPRISSR